MSFWNNPENSSLKILLIAIVVIGAGAFAYHAMNTGGDTGRVISPSTVAPTTGPVNAMKTCDPIDKVTVDGSSCTHFVQFADCTTATSTYPCGAMTTNKTTPSSTTVPAAKN